MRTILAVFLESGSSPPAQLCSQYNVCHGTSSLSSLSILLVFPEESHFLLYPTSKLVVAYVDLAHVHWLRATSELRDNAGDTASILTRFTVSQALTLQVKLMDGSRS